MSVINVILDTQGGRIYTDTLMYSAFGPAKPVGLAQAKCHMGEGFAMAFRGLALFSLAVRKMLDGCEGYDAAVAHLGCRVTETQMAAFIADELASRRMSGRGDATEVTICGHSPKTGRVTAYQRTFRHDGATSLKVLPNGIHLSPAQASLERSGLKLPPTATTEQAVKMALVQQAMSLRHDLNMCIGGLLHETSITPAGVTQRIVARYPGYEALREEFGCPNHPTQNMGAAA